VQLDPIKPTLKPTGTKRLKLKCDILLSHSAFKFNLRRFTMAAWAADGNYRGGGVGGGHAVDAFDAFDVTCMAAGGGLVAAAGEGGDVFLWDARMGRGGGRGLHSFTSQLNLSALYRIGPARRGCVARVKGVFRVCRVFLCVRHGSS